MGIAVSSNAIKDYVRSHVEDLNEPIELALAYDYRHGTDDICVLEVLAGGYGFDEPTQDKEIMETIYGGDGAFKITGGSFLHLLLTSANELRIALDDDWPSVRELREVIEQGNYEVVGPVTEIGRELLQRMQNAPIAR